ncbi:hypothetical protein DFJ74DRAFT_704759 [Hyaloraphidium curvatum]|nr:hypothetical protein DFJ74DRAFT_704759 [Hyaloraphidium curvatum]
MSASSPSRPARPAGVYVPRHRREAAEEERDREVAQKSDAEGGAVRRRGRGTFEAPSRGTQKLRTEGLKSARDFDATSLRTYPAERPERQERLKKTDVDALAGRVANSLALDGSAKDAAADGEGETSWEELANSVPISRPSSAPTGPPRATPSRKPVHVDGLDESVALECSGFPASWKTYHLEAAFTDVGVDKDAYRIKWVNDTSALIVFRSSIAAKQAYAAVCTNPFFKVRGYKGQLDNDRPAENEARPVTSDVVARRLISGALGIAAKKRTPEERATEDAKLKEAQAKREREAQARQQRQRDLDDAFGES